MQHLLLCSAVTSPQYTCRQNAPPKNIRPEASTEIGKIMVKAQSQMSIALKKRIKDSWTLTCTAVNVLAPRQDIIFEQEEFSRHIITGGYGQNFRVRLGANWTFKSGKAFNSKQVEKAGDENRM